MGEQNLKEGVRGPPKILVANAFFYNFEKFVHNVLGIPPLCLDDVSSLSKVARPIQQK